MTGDRVLVLFAIVFLLVSAQTIIENFATARNTEDRLTKKPNIVFDQKDEPHNHSIKINAHKEYQKIIGWGGALTEASSFIFSLLLPELQQELIDAYFSPYGLDYTIGRIHMGSADFSLNKYNCDNVTGDYELKHFNIERDKRYVLPLVKAAQAKKKDLQFFFSPWSPPYWMKVNGNMDDSAQPIGLINDTRIHTSWALYFSKFISAYQKEGVDFWGLTVQNEPEAKVPWPSCSFTPEAERDFIKHYLGPQLRKDHPNVKIMIHDHNRDRVEAFADAVLSDSSASQYVDGVAFHWYEDGHYHRLANIHEKYPNVFLLPTEACFLDGVHIDDYDRGEQYGMDIIKDLNHFAGGWVDWNIVIDPHGGPCHSVLRVDAPIIGDYINQTLHYQPMYFYLGQFTKFIPVGSVRVHVEAIVGEDVHVTAFKRPDNTVVLVVLNNGHREASFKIQDHDIQQVAHAKVHPHGIKTFIWKKA